MADTYIVTTMSDLDRLDPEKRIAALFLLPDCDMVCRFCASEQDFSVVSFEEAENLLRALRTRSIRNVVFGGGEPFLWPHDVKRLAARAQELGFLVQVSTNGVALPDDFERISSIDRYILPLEAVIPEVHDRLRLHVRGHHRLVLDRIATLAGSGRELTISTVVTRENIDELAEIAEFLAEQQRSGVALHAWHLYRFLPVGRAGRSNAQHLTVRPDAFVGVCDELKRRDLDFPVYRRDDMLRSRTVEFFWVERGELKVGSEVLAKQSLPAGGAV